MSEQTKTTKPVDNDPNSWRNREIGILYDNGERMSGFLTTKGGERVSIVLFKNKFKTEDRHPDWRIYKSLPKEGSITTPKKVESKSKPVAKKTVAPAPEENNEEFV